MHDGNRFFGILHRKIEDFSYVLFSVFTRSVTFIKRCFALYERLGKRVATSVTATATVSARKMTLYVVDTRVALNGKFIAKECEAPRKKSRVR